MKTLKLLLYPYLLLLLAISACSDDFVPPPEVISEDDYVDLRPQQTPLRDQQDRTTCIVFAGVGALEAAYKRFGYGDLDLSEEFINFTRKSWYLHPIWADHQRAGVHGRETQLGSTGGGGGVGVMAELSIGFKIPREEVMPYQSSNSYYLENFSQLQPILDKGSAATQRDYSDFNLDPRILDYDILHHDEWYSVGSYRTLANARDADEIEAVLKSKKEVVWDFAGAAPWDAGGFSDGTWQKCDDCGTIGHSMLIVGFDKRDPDPANHYFIVKNSWADGWTKAGLEGYTALSYDYVRTYGVGAGYINTVKGPESWPELAFIGRWKLNFDGWRGELDIYHLPGLARYIFEYNFNAGVIPQTYDDYRIGTFYDPQGQAYRVNGHVEGNRIEFYLDVDQPLLRWDEIQGRRFVYYLNNNDYMAGMHTDPDGRTYAGYATKADFLPGGERTPRPYGLGSYYTSRWQLRLEGLEGELYFTKILSGEFDEYILLEGTFTAVGSAPVAARLRVNADEMNKVYIQLSSAGSSAEPLSLIGKHLNREAGLITGHTPELDGTAQPFQLLRLP